MIGVWSVGHSCLDKLRAHQEDGTVGERNQTLQFFQGRLQDVCRLLAVVDRVQGLQEALDTV